MWGSLIFFSSYYIIYYVDVRPICRLNEAVMHFGESIKEIINEEFGDGM